MHFIKQTLISENFSCKIYGNPEIASGIFKIIENFNLFFLHLLRILKIIIPSFFFFKKSDFESPTKG